MVRAMDGAGCYKGRVGVAGLGLERVDVAESEGAIQGAERDAATRGARVVENARGAFASGFSSFAFEGLARTIPCSR